MDTNAKMIGWLVLLCLGTVGSPLYAQTPVATPDSAQGIVDSRKESGELLRRARVAMKRGNLDLAERLVIQAEKLGAPQVGILSRFADTPQKVRKDLAQLRAAQPAGAMAQTTRQAAPAATLTPPANVTPLPAAFPPIVDATGATATGPMDAQKAIQARSLMAQAKAAFDRNDLGLAENLTKQAASLQVPDGGFSGGHTPWEMDMKIQKQRRLAGIPNGNVAASNVAASNVATSNVATASNLAPLTSTPQASRGVTQALYNQATDATYVRQASAEEPVLPPTETLAQQVRGFNSFVQQPAPIAPAQVVPGSNNGFAPVPAAPYNTTPAPATTIATPQGIPTYATPQPITATPFASEQPLPPTTTPAEGQLAPIQTGISDAPDSYTIGPRDLLKMGEEKLQDRDLESAQDYFRQAWAMQDQLDPSTKQRLQEHLQLIQNDINREGTEENAEEKEEIARLNRLLADVSREQVAIRREAQDRPKEAWEKMKSLRQKLADTDLPADTRRRWVTKIEADIKEIEDYIETNRASIELDEQNREVLALIERERKMRVEVQNQLAKAVEEFNGLMDKQRFSEAYIVAKQAREIAPNHEVSEMMIWKSQFANRLYLESNLRSRNADMFANALDGGELETPDAYTLNTPMAFPKNWGEISTRTSLSGRDRSRFSAAEQEIERALYKKVQVQFDEAPLGDVIETLGRMTGINVFIDTEGLAVEGITTDTPVTMNLEKDISLRSVLNLILSQYRLGYVIQDEVLRITSETARDADVYREVYYVGDLVIPIPNFMPGHNNGLAGALAQAYSALGYGPGGIAQAGSQTNPLVIADNQQSNVGSPLALAQERGSSAMPGVPGMPQPPGVGGMGGASGADFDSLINLITSTVEPDSWDDVGGPGTVQSFDGNLSLVVSNTQEVHEAIVDLLEQLRRLQDLQVTIEVRFVTLQDNFFERIGVDFDFDVNDNTGFTSADLSLDNPDARVPEDGSDITIGLDPSGNPTVDLDLSFNQEHFGAALPQFGGFAPGIASTFGFAILSDIEAFFLIEAIQGDQRTNVMQAPKVTLFNGQFATINDTQNRPFVTSVIPVVGDFAVAQQPVIMVLAEGTQLSVQAVVSSDRRFVRLTMLPMFSQIGDVDTFTFEGRRSSTTGSTTETDPNDNTTETNRNEELFTEGTTVQLPNFATTSVSTTVSVPDGGTVLMGGIKRLAEGRVERGMPILSKLPYVSRLFKNVGSGRETQTLMMMVTPRIIIQEEEEEKVLGTPVP